MSESNTKYKYLVDQWDKFPTEIDESKLKKINGKFDEYIEKIKNGNLTLDEYTNIKSEVEDYFCNFMENTNKIFYGSAKPGNASNYGIYKDKDGKYIKDGKEITGDNLTNEFEKIRGYLNSLLNMENVQTAMEAEQSDDRPIRANQILKKLIAYNYMGNFLFMYADDAIDRLYSFFLPDDEATTNIEKNYVITAKVKEIFLQKEECDNKCMIKLSRFIWSIFGSTIELESKNMILHGAPGTGKTYSIKNTVKNIILQQGGSLDEQLVFIQFHPSYSYEDFIDGIKPTGIVDGQMQFKLKNGSFKELCRMATEKLKSERKDNKKDNELTKYFFVADEINRAELSRVFGELLICLEEDYRIDFDKDGNLLKEESLIITQNAMLDTNPVYEKGDKNYFGVPANLYFIGTMNDIDRSVDSFDMALRRRFYWKEIRCNYDFIDSLFNNSDYTKICKNLNRYITGYKEEKSNGKLAKIDKINSYESLRLGTAFELGHAYFKDIQKINKKEIDKLWNSKLEPLLKEYLRAEYSQDELIGKLYEAKNIFTLSKDKTD